VRIRLSAWVGVGRVGDVGRDSAAVGSVCRILEYLPDCGCELLFDPCRVDAQADSSGHQAVGVESPGPDQSVLAPTNPSGVSREYVPALKRPWF
jgi:hypothetical protein